MEYLILGLFVILGVGFGIFTGLTPGIHINLVASVIVSYSTVLLNKFDPLILAVMITAMAVTHTMMDIIPSTLLGIPNCDNLAMLLPAHRLTIEGKAKLAIIYGLIGGSCGIIATILFIPILIWIIPRIYTIIKPSIAIILIIICGGLIISKENKLISILFWLASGILGIFSFNIETIDQPLLPLLSGMFGISGIILSINNEIKLNEQKDVKCEAKFWEIGKYSFMTCLASFMTSFLPGLTSSHTALIANKLNKIKEQEKYIIISNIANSSATIISFVALYTIGKARSGAVAAIEYLIGTINISSLIFLMGISLVTLTIVLIIAMNITDKIINFSNKINYKLISICILIFIIFIVLVVTKMEGLIVLIIATAIGILAEKYNISRINLTGCLVLPVILYYFV